MLIDRVLESVERAPEAPAFISAGRVITYRQTRALLGRSAAHLRSQGVKRGDVVAFAMPQSPIYPVMLLALGWIGAIALPLAPNLLPADRAALLKKFAAAVLLTDQLEVVPPGCRLVQVETLAVRGDETMREAGERGFDAATPFRLALTSGTTGVPKGVMQTHGGFEERLERMHCDFAEVPRVIAPGMQITIAINLVMHALCKGGTVIIPQSYGKRGLLEAIERFDVTHVTMPPANLALVLPDLPAGKPSFPGVRHLRVVGSTPSPSLIEQAFDRFTPHVFVPYGLGEVGLVSMAAPEMLREDPVTAGVLEPGVRLRLSESGEMSVHIPGQADDYYGPDAGLGTRFRGDGFFHPGDRGRVSDSGRLYIDGRIDNIINLGGFKISPEYIEAVLMEFEGVREAAVFAAADAAGETMLVAAIVCSSPIDWEALRQHGLRRMDVIAPGRYLEVSELPRNAMGKLERGKLSESALAGAKTGV